MRISDWSSDVCSSDLLDSFGRFIEQQQRRLACQGPADRQLLLLSPRQHARLAVGDLGQLGKQVIDHVGDLLRTLEALARQCRQADLEIFGEREMRKDMPALRSEENTSELQTHMRSSYARF